MRYASCIFTGATRAAAQRRGVAGVDRYLRLQASKDRHHISADAVLARVVNYNIYPQT